jgi:PIN domain nuclease of toxin-antitoxin system
MKILLDTHILIWAAEEVLPACVNPYFENRANKFLFSAVNIWESAIKHALKRSDFPHDPAILYNRLLKAGYEELPITARHTLYISNLPQIHKDPFDRILLAQAMCENIPLLTADKGLSQYAGPVIYVG